ncbi:hypothetical protein WJX81_004884 [Elliptochloris bilobata]|uniref:RRM domain-containing protein n=1 Tax=Elliptochloris bilobata TaxID=381761 RepID=A0AAW1QVH4_9CHLO
MLQPLADPSALGCVDGMDGMVPADQGQGKALYVGNLNPSVDEHVLQQIFGAIGVVSEVKVIKDKVSNKSAGYGFVKFMDPRSAEQAMAQINRRVLFNQEVRVNWAFQKDQREDTSSHFHIFVGDLVSEYNDAALFEAFKQCPGCSEARVMWDHTTNRSKGYGFVAFRTREEAERALNTMNGTFLGHRRIRCGWAQHKQDTSSCNFGCIDRADPTNANVYVGNVAADITEADLHRAFQMFGVVLEVKIYRKGSYGFVQFERHEDAVRAIVNMNGGNLGGRALKCSWGRHQARHNEVGMVGGLAAVAAQQQQLLRMQQAGLATGHLPSLQDLQAMQAGGALGPGLPGAMGAGMGAMGMLSPQAMMLAGGGQHAGALLSPQHGAYLTAIAGAPGGAGGALGSNHSALTLGPSAMMGLGAAQAGGPAQALDPANAYYSMYQQYSYPM